MNNVIKQDMDFIINNKLDWEGFAGKTVLITGANGFLPSYMVYTLLHLNNTLFRKTKKVKVIGVVRNIEKAKAVFKEYANDGNLKLVHHDVCQPFDTQEKVDFIIHAASQASPKYFGSDPVGTINANTIGTHNFLELAKRKNVEGFLYFSSGEVNGKLDDSQIPTKEEDYGYIDPLNVRSCYSEGKRAGENMCACYAYQYNIPIKIVRPSHVYGPGMDLNDGRVFADFVKNILEGQDITLNSDGQARRCFCYLADATAAFFTVLLKGESSQAYNVGNSHDTGILELAQILVGLFQEKKLDIKLNINNNVQGYIRSASARGWPDISKIKTLGWSPFYSVEEGFKRTVGSFIC